MSSKLNKILLSKKRNYKIIHYNQQNLNDILEILADLINKEADIIEFRAENCESKKNYDICTKIREISAAFDILFVVFDRIDIAKLTGADGICLNKNSLSPDIAKQLTEDEIFIGYEIQDNEEISADFQSNLDYIILSKENQEDYNIKTFLPD